MITPRRATRSARRRDAGLADFIRGHHEAILKAWVETIAKMRDPSIVASAERAQCKWPRSHG